jgi:hypothetical protein
MVHASIHFPNDQIEVEFENENAFVKWLGYLKDHGLASVKLTGSAKSVIVFRTNVSYIETATEAGRLGLQ